MYTYRLPFNSVSSPTLTVSPSSGWYWPVIQWVPPHWQSVPAVCGTDQWFSESPNTEGQSQQCAILTSDSVSPPTLKVSHSSVWYWPVIRWVPPHWRSVPVVGDTDQWFSQSPHTDGQSQQYMVQVGVQGQQLGEQTKCVRGGPPVDSFNHRPGKQTTMTTMRNSQKKWNCTFRFLLQQHLGFFLPRNDDVSIFISVSQTYFGNISWSFSLCGMWGISGLMKKKKITNIKLFNYALDIQEKLYRTGTIIFLVIFISQMFGTYSWYRNWEKICPACERVLSIFSQHCCTRHCMALPHLQQTNSKENTTDDQQENVKKPPKSTSVDWWGFSLSETHQGWKFGLTPLPSLRSKTHEVNPAILPYIPAHLNWAMLTSLPASCVYIQQPTNFLLSQNLHFLPL